MKRPEKEFALCIDNRDNEASLILGKIYRVLSDPTTTKDGLARIVDESGEDYLFDRSRFVFVDFPQAIRRKILALQKAS